MRRRQRRSHRSRRRCRRGTTARIEEGDRRLRRAGDAGGQRRLRAAGRADRRLRQRRHAVGRAADLRAARVRARPRQGAGAAASRVEDAAAVQGGPRGRREGASPPAGETRPARDHGRDPRRQDDRGVRARSSATGSRTAQHPKTRAALHRDGLPADAGGARATCARTASRPSSCPAAASSSCGRGRSASTASRPSRSSAAASR